MHAIRQGRNKGTGEFYGKSTKFARYSYIEFKKPLHNATHSERVLQSVLEAVVLYWNYEQYQL